MLPMSELRTKLGGNTTPHDQVKLNRDTREPARDGDRLMAEALHLHRHGELTQAEPLYRQVLAATPRHAEALHLLGVVAVQQQRFEEADRLIAEALAISPDWAEALSNRAVALRGLGNLDQALASCDKALAVRPDFGKALSNRGNVLRDLGRLEEALASYDRALAIQPDFAETYNELGTVLQKLNRSVEATAKYQQALALNPDYVEAHNNLANALRAQGRLDEAVVHYRKALALKSDIPETNCNLGLTLSDLGEFDAALAHLRQALALKPDMASAHNNLAIALYKQGRYEEARASCERSLALNPDGADAHVNLAMTHLVLGDFANGWREFEWRWRTGQLPPLEFVQPQWAGEAVNGRVLLLHAEQGFGDTIQFCRYATLAAAKARVILRAPAALARLLSSLEGVERIVVEGEPLPAFDLHCPLLSLPHLFGTTLATVPDKVPYLRTDPARVHAWRPRVTALPGLRVGLCWAGEPKKPPTSLMDRERSMSLDQLAALAGVAGVSFVSLQKGDAAAQIRSAPSGLIIHDWTDEITDFADTAALVETLDLVVTVDTAVAHLAGALGKPVWLLNRAQTCWRWLLGRNDSPWYPTLRLFRQPTRGDWQPVVDEVVNELTKLAVEAGRQPGRQVQAAATPTATATTTADPQADFKIALQHHQAGRLAEAEAIYRRILESDPEHADSLQLLGALSLQFDRTDEAIELLQRAVDIRPRYAEAHNNLGVALQKRGEIEQAVSHWEKAVALKPDYAQAYCNLAKALSEQGKTGLALACWERAVALTPDDVGAHGDFAAALQRANRFGEAVAHYERALALKPDHVEMHCSFAAALRSAGRPSEAIARYQKALALAPDHVGAHVGIGTVLETEGKTGDATAHYERAIALRPDLAHLRFRLCTAQLPILYLDEAEIEGRRTAYRKRLEQLCADVEARRVGGDLAAAVGSNQPFYLPYQGQSDRDLQSKYGALTCRAIADKYPAAAMPPPPAPGEKVRLGIVSGFFRHHSNWKIPIKGWLSQLDRSKFQIFGYYTGTDRDAQTEIAAKLCDRFVQGPLPGDRWREEILADRPHILIYPEIGMDPGAAWLAAHRLAPIQCTSWGHPNTTGYPTLDYFLSSDLMEPPDAEQHYTERLIRLPNLSIYYEPLELSLPQFSREQLGLRPSSVAYWCGQSLFKYLPQFDQVFPRIARQVGDCQFVFIQSHHGGEITARLRRRLDRAFAVFGLDAGKHCVFLPRLGLEQFAAAIGRCDVVLDSIGWSGCNSTLEGLAHDTPVVTMPGSLMRGRHTTAILKMMGVTETIAETVDDYVAIAARLGRDGPWRRTVSQRISENKHRVYRNSAVTAALEEFLCRVARGEAEPDAQRQAAASSSLASDQVECAVALDPPAQLNFSPHAGATQSAPQAGDLRSASHRNTPNRKQRRSTSAATDVSAIQKSKRRGPKHNGVFQREGA